MSNAKVSREKRHRLMYDRVRHATDSQENRATKALRRSWD